MVDAPTVLDQPLELVGDEAVLARASVVGHQVELVTGPPHLVFEDQHVLAARSHDADDVVFGLFHGHGGRIRDRRADPTTHHDDRPEALDLGRLPQGADDVANGIADVQSIEQTCRLADPLHDDRDAALLII